MKLQERIQKLAKLGVKIGANVQKGQTVIIRANVEHHKMANMVAEEAYKAGAKRVIIQWSSDDKTLLDYEYQTVETLSEKPRRAIENAKYAIDEKAVMISITSQHPGLLKDADPEKVKSSALTSKKHLKFFSDYMMGNGSQWTIIAVPNPVWAKTVFPNIKDEEEAVNKLWDAILKASRVYEDNDPIKDWNKHNKALAKHNEILNKHHFKHLHFKNSLGTDLIVGLAIDHEWAGGGDLTVDGVYFNPNIPTEENFCMPHKYMTEGKVYATKPLNYQGKVIKDFWFEFKEGKVVDYDAKESKDALDNLLNTDEGSRYIGEIALISHDSPISNMDILFYSTLFDENASCHIALGQAYPMNIKGGVHMSLEELKERGYNESMNHVDFMFGSADMKIVGTKFDGTEVVIFEDGNFVI